MLYFQNKISAQLISYNYTWFFRSLNPQTSRIANVLKKAGLSFSRLRGSPKIVSEIKAELPSGPAIASLSLPLP
jgi:hypothetical protein